MGYNFNPVSFYYCFNKQDNPICVVPEVGNTFGELKPFYLGEDKFMNNRFEDIQQKNFYVSPFIDHDVFFKFSLAVPGKSLSVKIDDYKEGNRIFVTSLFGKEKKLSDFSLLWNFIKFPFVTLKVIAAIHWQALILYLKKIRLYKKEEKLELQKELLKNGKSKLYKFGEFYKEGKFNL